MIGTARRFLRLSFAEQYACCAAATLLLSARILLRENHFDFARRRTRGIARVLHVMRARTDLITCVERARRHVPWRVTCLHEALAAEALLKNAGHECTLCIGARAGRGGQEFHAWVAAGPDILVGETADAHALLYCPR